MKTDDIWGWLKMKRTICMILVVTLVLGLVATAAVMLVAA